MQRLQGTKIVAIGKRQAGIVAGGNRSSRFAERWKLAKDSQRMRHTYQMNLRIANPGRLTKEGLSMTSRLYGSSILLAAIFSQPCHDPFNDWVGDALRQLE